MRIETKEMDKFYNSLNDIAKNMNLSEVEKAREEVKNIVKNFSEYVDKKQIPEELDKTESIVQDLEHNLDTIKYSVKEWENSFNELDKQDKFKEDLKNYFIVMIFGKVKAGKSSLGNFIAENAKNRKMEVSFFKYDEAGKEQKIGKLEEIIEDDSCDIHNKEKGFATNNLECTSEIQGFKLNGLAWIDTPGLGSMREENGKLAQEYINAADYVIYPTSSASPLQRDEKDSVKELFSYNKKVTICITKSDTTGKRKDANGKWMRDPNTGKIGKFLINKDENNRNLQADYVKTEIKKILPKNEELLLGNIISISAHTAKKGLEEDDKELFDGSNIEKFYEIMNDVLKNKAKEIKNNSPINSLKSFITNTLLEGENSFEKLKEELSQTESNIKSSLKEMEKSKKSLLKEAQFIIGGYRTTKIDSNNSKKFFSELDKKIMKEISEKMSESIFEIMKDFNKKMETNVRFGDVREVEKRYEEISVRYDKTGFFRNIANKATFGLVEREYDYVTKRVEIGDNSFEVLDEYIEDRLEKVGNLIEKNYKNLEISFFVPLDQSVRELKDKISRYENKIKVIVDNLGVKS